MMVPGMQAKNRGRSATLIIDEWHRKAASPDQCSENYGKSAILQTVLVMVMNDCRIKWPLKVLAVMTNMLPRAGRWQKEEFCWACTLASASQDAADIILLDDNFSSARSPDLHHS